jgi:hypothetical protein
MYRQFYGFDRPPFALTPDPAFLYRSRQHEMALTLLEYGLESRAVIALLTGEVGTGKTTLLRHLRGMLGKGLTIGVMTNTHSGFISIHPWIVSAFGIVSADNSDVALYEAIVAFLREEGRCGRRALLIVDEAQNLSPAILEQLRLLSNVNEAGDLVLQIFLVGQPELRETLRRQDLRQLAQRISADYHLHPFNAVETAAYIRHRLTAAGGSPDRFDANALERVYSHTGGIPRLINRLCDMALVYGYAMKQAVIDIGILDEVMADRRDVGALPLTGPATHDLFHAKE